MTKYCEPPKDNKNNNQNVKKNNDREINKALEVQREILQFSQM